MTVSCRYYFHKNMLNCKGMMTRKLCIHFLSRKNFKSIDIPVPNCYSCARISARSVSANQSKHSEKGTSQFKDLHEIPGPFRLPLLGTSWMYWKLGPYSRHTFHQADIGKTEVHWWFLTWKTRLTPVILVPLMGNASIHLQISTRNTVQST